MTPFLLALLLPAAACAAEPVLPKDALPVPLVAQAVDYSCGPAALLSVLWYWQVYDGGESALGKELGTDPKEGTPPVRLVESARRRGLAAELREGLSVSDLRAALRRGETLILDIQAWREPAARPRPWGEEWENGHYVVLVGLDAENAYLMDPSAYGAYAWLPLAELQERWHDYEKVHGGVRRYHHLGVVIRGRKPLGRGVRLLRVE